MSLGHCGISSGSRGTSCGGTGPGPLALARRSQGLRDCIVSFILIIAVF
jgi:hypothetical protein